jgi:hypothetical protein
MNGVSVVLKSQVRTAALFIVICLFMVHLTTLSVAQITSVER